MASNKSRSPFAPKKFPTLPAIDGLRFATHASGSRYRGRDDVLFAIMDKATKAAGVFTRSATAAAPVDICRQHLAITQGRARALVVNAGIANAFTGKQGVRAALQTARCAAQIADCALPNVLVASTGVIGVDLDPKPICAALRGASFADTSTFGQNWQAAAKAIMTTDSFPKAATRSAAFGKHKVRLNAIAKGSGMVAPDMATVLAFVFTDAALPTSLLQKLLRAACDESFNAISVDSDTSTSDTCLLFATGQKKMGGAPLRSVKDRRLKPFIAALRALMIDIAVQTVSDGEGISRLMVIDVSGARDDMAARRIGLAIGNSPLVKTAVAGGDANWGRIVMAIGKSGEAVVRDRLAIDIGGHKVARNGRVVPHYKEAPIARHFRGRHVHIAVDVGVKQLKKSGKKSGKARVWASDLTHGYIRLNADYRS